MNTTTRNRLASPTFQCARCGNCCRWPGRVRLRPEETNAIARFLGLSPYEFTARFTRLLPSRAGLGLTETADSACVFLTGNDCRIHAVKPRQCRDFPTAWARDEEDSPCRAGSLVQPKADSRF